jgi:chromosomal replication initiation ATPase DnaA
MGVNEYCDFVIQETCKQSGVTPEELKSPTKRRKVIAARRRIIIVLMRETGLPTSSIGKMVGIKNPQIGKGSFKI